jgi:hypothetical protein
MKIVSGATLATAILLAAMTSCSTNGNHPAATKTPALSSPARTTATTTTSPSDSELAAEAASAAVRNYYATVDRLGQQPSVPLRDLSAVATGVQLSAQQNLLRNQRRANERQVGDTKIARLEVQSVNLDNSDPSAGKVPTVEVDVCWDVTNVDVVDMNGKSIVSANRPNTGWTRLTVANYHYADDTSGGWRVATGQDLKRNPCAAS